MLPVQYVAQLEPLHKAGYATAAYDYLGCGRSEKPTQYGAYAASELYADLQAVFRKYTEVHCPLATRLSLQSLLQMALHA